MRGSRRAGTAAASLALLPLLGCSAPETRASAGSSPRVIVLGFDGLDYGLATKLMSEGQMPSFSKLARTGSFTPLISAIPPQSPVAWSSFITGLDPGGHGIFDFVHRDPDKLLPTFSSSQTRPPARTLKLGRWALPLSAGKVKLLRHGQAFWEPMEAAGVRTSILRIPANFPPSGTATRELSGMGTPDILGTYGTFLYYTSDYAPFAGRSVGGGKVYKVEPRDNLVICPLYGPDHPYLVKRTKLRLDFQVYLDPDRPLAKVVVGREERLLRQGEWSDWVPIEFPLLPARKLRVMTRFHLKQVRPTFSLYLTPLNLDPLHPAMPISHPPSYAASLARATGRFYTQGMPEDTKALSQGVFDRREFLTQAAMAQAEVLAQYREVLAAYREGLLFYYFGNLDQVSHMMWRPLDPGHPRYDPVADPPFAGVIPGLYRDFDAIVAYTLEHMPPDALLVVMSDHGFTSWRRTFHLNAWLRDAGYLAVRDPSGGRDQGLLTNVDWSRTRAYGLGLNGLYVNLEGREKHGIVPPAQRAPLMAEIQQKLLEVIDPATGSPAITRVFNRDRDYRHQDHVDVAPDLILGYARGTRCSNDSALGWVPAGVFADNDEAWSGDHCMDPDGVPGVLLTSRPLGAPAESLEALAPALLAEYGISGFPTP